MSETILPPSPNWYLSSIITSAKNIVAWGARHTIVIARRNESCSKINFSMIEKAHFERVVSLTFCIFDEDDVNNKDSVSFIADKLQDCALVSAGDDNIVKVWNPITLELVLTNSVLDNNHKIIAVDSSKNNYVVCYISEKGSLVIWDIKYNINRIIHLGKISVTCLSCCPHDKNLLAVGLKTGLIYIVDLSKSENHFYKLRTHDAEIASLSWCPVPVNVFNETEKELLLASADKNKLICLWKAISGRFRSRLTLSNKPSDTESHKSKGVAGNFIALNWIEKYTILSSSPWGEIIQWNFVEEESGKNFKAKLLHGIHTRGVFAIAAESEMRKSQEKVQAIWTISQDRNVIRYDREKNEADCIIPTQAGFVHCISACPQKPYQVAFGVGDGMIRLWKNLESHNDNNIINLKFLWQKIKGQVRSLAWHPEKKDILAYATDEGRIGEIDLTKPNTPPTLYRQYFTKIVYSLGWGPAPKLDEYVLYACGDEKLVYFPSKKPEEKPISVTNKTCCTEFSWNSDYSLIALGFKDGSIKILNRNLTEYTDIHVLNKAIYCLKWHPQNATIDVQYSKMKNYLAVGTINSIISIFNITTENDSNRKFSEKSPYRTVAHLNGHADKISCLAWNPHVAGYLVSGSYDSTVQVWKVETQEIIATYKSHTASVLCCMWSPHSQGDIITGGADLTLRIWHTVDHPPIKEIPKILKRSKKIKKKEKNTDALANTSTEIETELSESQLDTHQTVSRVQKKKRSKKTTYFPGYAKITNNNELWCASARKLFEIVKDDNERDEMNQDNRTIKDTEEIKLLLGNKQNFEEALRHEKELLASNNHYQIITEMEHWGGNLKEHLKKASQDKLLNDFLVSLAPCISKEMWVSTCEAYAEQLNDDKRYHRAVSYYLGINKIQKAIEVFIEANLYREAYVLAVSRLQSNDPMIENIIETWAKYAESIGQYKNATECYIKLKEYVKAAKVLEKQDDVDSLMLAIDLAKKADDLNLSIALADKAVFEALLTDNVEAAQSVIHGHPEIKYREIEVKVFNELSKILNSINDEAIFSWLKGLSNTALLETLRKDFKKTEIKYSTLVEKDVPLWEINDKMIQIKFSHQLALSIIADQQKLQLQNLVKAFDFILKCGKSSVTLEKTSRLIYYIFLLDNKNLTESTSFFNSTEDEISKSLRAYLCYAIIEWFLDNKLSESEITECMDSIEVILTKCMKDLLDRRSFEFWTVKKNIDKVEKHQSTLEGPLDIEDDGEKNEINELVQNLEKLKIEEKQFLEERISSPHPLDSYDAVLKMCEKVKDEKIYNTIKTLVTEAYNNATS